MTTVLLGLGAALLIGFADFFGSMAGRKGRILAVTFWVFVAGIVVIVAGALIVGGSPSTRDLVLGGIAGIGGGVGLLILYAGYAKTRIGIVGPVGSGKTRRSSTSASTTSRRRLSRCQPHPAWTSGRRARPRRSALQGRMG